MAGYPSLIVPVDHREPVPRRLRGFFSGQTVFDTMAAVYVWEVQPYPAYYVPMEDVDPAVLVEEGHVSKLKRGTAARYGLRAGSHEKPGVARLFTDGPLAGLVRFDWGALDSWFEEDEEVFVHPRSPYTRVDAIRSTRTVRVSLTGAVLAESSSPVMVFETGLPTRYYLNRTGVDFGQLTASDTVTACPYKGRTTAYWSVGEARDLAWSYDFPTAPLLPIAGLVCFYNEKVDIAIDGVEQERPVTHFS